VSLVEAFRKGLRQVGLIENQNIVLDIVWSGNDPDQAVKEVLGRGAELLITSGSSTSVAAKRQTSTIPIVFLHVGDPVAVGLIESLSRPGQNATGFSDILAELSGRLVDLAKELNKSQSSVSYLWYTDWPDGQHRYALTREAAEKIGLEVRANPITNIAQLNDVLITIKQRGSTAFIVQPSPFTYAERGQIIAAAIKYGLGTIFAFPVAAKEGSLVAYGPDYLHIYSRAPIYVDRILKGSKPAEGRARVNIVDAFGHRTLGGFMARCCAITASSNIGSTKSTARSMPILRAAQPSMSFGGKMVSRKQPRILRPAVRRAR